MILTKVTCDSCGRDLSETTNCEDWRISLSNQGIPSKGGAVTAMMVEKPLPGSSHFCGVKCLKNYCDRVL